MARNLPGAEGLRGRGGGEGGGEGKRNKEKKGKRRGGGGEKKKEGTSFDFVRTKPDSLIERFLLTRL